MITPMDEAEFRKALYYAVREDFNADITKGHIERNPKLNQFIIDAIAFYESHHRIKKFPYQMSMIELICLARASGRRRLSPLKGSRSTAP